MGPDSRGTCGGHILEALWSWQGLVRQLVVCILMNAIPPACKPGSRPYTSDRADVSGARGPGSRSAAGLAVYTPSKQVIKLTSLRQMAPAGWSGSPGRILMAASALLDLIGWRSASADTHVYSGTATDRLYLFPLLTESTTCLAKRKVVKASPPWFGPDYWKWNPSFIKLLSYWEIISIYFINSSRNAALHTLSLWTHH